MKKNIIRFLFLSLFVGIMLSDIHAQVQNRYEEIIPYENVDGKIVIQGKIKGKEYKFLFTSERTPSTAILKSMAVGMGIELTDEVSGVIEGLGIGETVFHPKMKAKIISNESLARMEVAGVIGIEVFAGNVVTIDSKEKTITITTPYKPDYIQLKNRMDIKPANKVNVLIDKLLIPVDIDLTADYMLVLNSKDYNSVASSLKNKKSGASFKVSKDYQAVNINGEEAVLSQFTFGKKILTDQVVYTSPEIKESSIGTGILDYGLLSIDYSKAKAYFEPFETLERVSKPNISSVEEKKEGEIIHLNRPAFLKDVFNFRENKQWKYEGTKSAVIDYWAEWCGPCKKLNPILKELASEYQDRVIFYKVNIDDEKEIANHFKITSIPLLMYLPVDGEPIVVLGIRSKEQIKQIIEEQLLKNK